MNSKDTKQSKSNQSKNVKKNKIQSKTIKGKKTLIKQTGCWGPDLSSKQLHELNELFGSGK